jgi:uncharacterized protein YcaQ
VESIAADQARFLAQAAQGLAGPIAGASPGAVQRMGQESRRGLLHQMLRHLGAVQLDTISVLARSHELVAYARFGAIGREAIEDSYWRRNGSFEYWSHAACILPIESWPLFSFRRRHYERRGIRWHNVTHSAVQPVLDRLADGPLSTSDIGGAKKGGEWWDWSESKIAIEWLLDIGTVVVARREGWRRVYDLAERCVPAELLSIDLSDEECVVALIADAARTLGVGTAGDIADVHRVKQADVRRHASDAGLVPVTVEGWSSPAYAATSALDSLQLGSRRVSRTTMLSPFDSLVWHRPRAERIFGMAHRLEAYTPSHRRVHGYFAMPVLHQGHLVGRVDPKREGTTLVAKRITFEDSQIGRNGQVKAAAVAGTAKALHEAALWVASEDIRVDEVVPASSASAVRQAVASGG